MVSGVRILVYWGLRILELRVYIGFSGLGMNF